MSIKPWRRILSWALTLAILCSLAVPGVAAGSESTGGITWEQVPGAGQLLPFANPFRGQAAEPLYAEDETVRVSIVLRAMPAIALFPTPGIADNAGAMRYRSRLEQNQDSIASVISEEALDGDDLDVAWNLTLTANIISANVPYGKIDEIRNIRGIQDVVLETEYLPADTDRSEAVLNMATSGELIGSYGAWAEGHTGAGSVIAVIDTGLDTDHELFDAAAFDHAIETDGGTAELVTDSQVARRWGLLHAAEKNSGIGGRDAYLNSKIPFAYNYVDANTDVTHDHDSAGDHGSHVAGIAAANRFINNGDGTFTEALEAVNVNTQGVAPDAQLLIMKVFGANGGAFDSDYMAAIEDAILLGADAINLSLGSASSGFTTSDIYQNIFDNLANTDTVLTVSAGNNGAWADETTGGALYSDGVNFSTGGSPGTYANTMTVASVDNVGAPEKYLRAGSHYMSYDDTYSTTKLTALAGRHPFVYIDSYGAVQDSGGTVTVNQFAALAEAGVDLSGAILLCNRGKPAADTSSSYALKANAAGAAGAAGILIVNNQDGVTKINMNNGYNYPDIPFGSLTQLSGKLLRLAGTKEVCQAGTPQEFSYYTGTLYVSRSDELAATGEHVMSSFSSWGVPGDLSLKPDIAAPGRGIYSVNGTGGYTKMSGTSMAAPQVAGMSALLAEYIASNRLTEKTGKSRRFLMQSLLMSTAVAEKDENGCYYSVMQQGAGLGNISSALTAKSYIAMDSESTASYADGKVKAELGDDPARRGSYTFGFSVHNFSEAPVTYDLRADFFTQDVYSGTEENTGIDFLGTSTEGLLADVIFSVDGTRYVQGTDLGIDVNGDGACSAQDAVALLEYVTSGTVPDNLPSGADADGDGKYTTYDVYLILQALSGASVTVPAGETVEIQVDASLLNIGQYDDKGAYVEGYVILEEQLAGNAEEDEAEIHSIPVLGYYGSWIEPDMTDWNTVYNYRYETDTRTPYMNQAFEAAYSESTAQERTAALYSGGLYIRHRGASETYAMLGNPYLTDEVYRPERNAVQPSDTIDSFRYSLIRNAGQERVQISRTRNGSITVLRDETLEPEYCAFYNINSKQWVYYASSAELNYRLSGAAGVLEGDRITFSFAAAPEYYTRNGTADWDALGSIPGAGHSVSYAMTVDGTKPDFLGAERIEGTNILRITTSDNRHVAAVLLCNEDYYENGDQAEKGYRAVLPVSYADEDNVAANETGQARFDLDDVPETDGDPISMNHLFVQVLDYAGNYTTYKLNLDAAAEPGETPQAASITLAASELSLVTGESYQNAASVYPWGIPESVTWSSSDSNVASVDQNGVITGTGAGSTVITAASSVTPSVTATCSVSVRALDVELQAMIREEDGQVWPASFHTADPAHFTKAAETPMQAGIVHLAFDTAGSLYGATFAENENASFYAVDPETYAATLIGQASAPYYALAGSSVFSGIVYAAMGPYILAVDCSTGDYLGYAYAGIAIAGLANAGSESYAGATVDNLYAVDQNGVLYQIYALYDPENHTLGVHRNTEAIGSFGQSADTLGYQSLYVDGDGNVFWSRYSAGVQSLSVLPAGDAASHDLGSFPDGVWLVTGLHRSAGGGLPAGGLHGAEISEDIEDGEDAGTVTLRVTADETSTNGLITVTYDEQMTYVADSAASGIAYHAIHVDTSARTVTVGYASLEPVQAGDAVMTLKFARGSAGSAAVQVRECNRSLEAGAAEQVDAGTMGAAQEISWTFSTTDERVTIHGAVSAARPVLVADYDASGRMRSLTAIQTSGGSAAVSPDPKLVKIFWISGSGAPLSESAAIPLTE